MYIFMHLQSMKMLQCTETGCWVRIYGNPQTQPPLQMPDYAVANDSMARLCSFLLDCTGMNKNGAWERRKKPTAPKLSN